MGRPPRPSPWVTGPPVDLRLGLRLDVTPGEAVSAGPVWDVSRYLLTDGAAYLTGPTVDLSGAHEWVVCWERATAGIGHRLCGGWKDSAHYARSYATSTQVQTSAALAEGVERVSSIATAYSGAHTQGAAVSSTPRPVIWMDNGSTLGGTESCQHVGAGASTFVAASKATGGVEIALANLKIRWVGLRRTGNFATANRTAIGGGGTTDPRPLTSEAFDYLWPMGLVYDAGGGVYKVRDLITTDGTTDLTVVSGDLGDFPEAA